MSWIMFCRRTFQEIGAAHNMNIREIPIFWFIFFNTMIYVCSIRKKRIKPRCAMHICTRCEKIWMKMWMDLICECIMAKNKNFSYSFGEEKKSRKVEKSRILLLSCIHITVPTLTNLIIQFFFCFSFWRKKFILKRLYVICSMVVQTLFSNLFFFGCVCIAARLHLFSRLKCYYLMFILRFALTTMTALLICWVEWNVNVLCPFQLFWHMHPTGLVHCMFHNIKFDYLIVTRKKNKTAHRTDDGNE